MGGGPVTGRQGHLHLLGHQADQVLPVAVGVHQGSDPKLLHQVGGSVAVALPPEVLVLLRHLQPQISFRRLWLLELRSRTAVLQVQPGCLRAVQCQAAHQAR
jgi:hypothetical protein